MNRSLSVLQSALWLSAVLSILPISTIGEEAGKDDPFAHLEWRNVGPVNMSGRVADVESVPGDPRTVYVGAASGGIWKSTDGGLTFQPIFDDQPIASIGDLALAPSNPEVIYAGSGEGNVRNSVSFGNGVYKSTDGGASWTHVGLEDTRHISRVVVHPTNPDVVYVAAIGHIYGPNEERGVFRTTDGGKSWEKVLYTDDRHGAADLDLDPTNPNILFAALWHFERKPWTMTSGGEEGGVYRSVDGGTTWKKLEKGLPKMLGRIGVKIAPSNPEVVYVIAESNDGTLFRSDDRGETFIKVSEDVTIVSRGFYYTDLRVDPSDENRIYAIASRLFRSIDGGKSFERIARKVHIDFHSLWIDPKDPRRLWVGQDGGVAVSYDRGDSWEPIRNLPLAQFYQVFFDQREPFYYLGGGLQDNGAWYGPSRTREPAGILPDEWKMMSFGDAYWVVPHPEQVDLYLSESQAGGIVRTDMRTRQQIDVSPQPRRNDGGPAGELEVRFNWNAPIIASPHDPMTVYFAGSKVFKTLDFGDTWETISPDLTTADPDKLGNAGGPVWPENTTAEYHCTVISFAESPVEAGVLWAGTDDGNLQLSRDGGETWTNLVTNVPGLPEFSPVSHIEPSITAAGTAYAAFDRHMFDDFRPHIFRTTDFGATWTRISGGIAEDAWVWALREDPKNPQLIYAGTELGLWATFDGGGEWRELRLKNLPTVAVHDVLVHPRENDLILGTHGRAIFVFDDATALQQWSDVPEDAAALLFDLRPAMRFPVRFTRYGLGDKKLVAPNPPAGALITYYLKESLETEPEDAEEDSEAGDTDTDDGPVTAEAEEDRIRIEILDSGDEVIRTLDEVDKNAGVHRVAWDLSMDPPRQRTDDKPEPSEFFGRGPRGPRVLPGTYTVRLTVDGESQEKTVEVTVDPLVDVTAEELQKQFEAAAQLTEMRSGVNDALRGIDSFQAQLEERRTTAKLLKNELPGELEESIKSFEEALKARLESLTKDPDKPFWSLGPRLSQRLGNLFGNIDGAFAAPTMAQAAYLVELEAEYAEAMTAWNRFLSEDVAELNRLLDDHRIPKLAVPRAIELNAGS